MNQAKFEGEKLPWYLKECCDDPNMDRHVRVLAPQLLHLIVKRSETIRVLTLLEHVEFFQIL